MLLARSYSHHSLLSAIPKVPALVKAAKAKGYTTIALTDEDTGSSFVEFFDVCKKNDINPAVGTTLKIPNLLKVKGVFGKNVGFSKVSLLAKDNQGYKDLMELVSIARTVQEEPVSHITLENLEKYSKDGKSHFFTLLTGNDHEIVANLRSGKEKGAEKILKTYVDKLGHANILVELAFSLDKDDIKKVEEWNKSLVNICDSLKVRYVASSAPRYIEEEDKEAFRSILAIRNRQRLGDIQLQRDFNLISTEKLAAIYSYIPGIENTDSIEEEIDIDIRYDYDKHADEAFFPNHEIPDGQDYAGTLVWETYINFLNKFHSDTAKTKQDWINRYPYNSLDDLKVFAATVKPDNQSLKGYPENYFGTEKTVAEYIERIEYELDIIIQKGYPSYFLVFAGIMQFCRSNNIVAGTRGSAAGSIVGYLIDINILDPLIYNLPFERFLNPLRPSAPDIDGDFADDGRQKVIEYITEKYGSENVTQIITFGTMLPRAAVRDVGRVLGVAYKKCDSLAKLIPTPPQGKKATFSWALETSEELAEVYAKDAEVKRVIDISMKIEGNYRHSSSHAAGVVISPTKMSDYCPLQWDSEHKMIICQYDMRTAEKVGLVKLDILGIRNFAILGNAVKIAERQKKVEIDLFHIDVANKKTFDLLSKGRTIGLFQLGGGGMTRWMLELKPERIEDIMALVALYRPGPMANIPEYIKRKRNPKLVRYYTPQMEGWMKKTYGILVYQDDLLYTVINLAGYNWLDADKFRKGVGKKIQSIMDEQHIKFVKGCQVHSGLTEKKAEDIWDVMVPFAAYGFNKAHASSYGMIAYWTAYMKAEYPTEFMTALMTAESNNLVKIALAIKECQDMGIEVLPPDVNKSYNRFSIEVDGVIRYGLDSVKGLPSNVVEFLIEDRDKNGEFASMEDFIGRMAFAKGFDKRALDSLTWSGSLDILGSRVGVLNLLK